MSENVSAEAQEVGSRDFEQEFYTLLSEATVLNEDGTTDAATWLKSRDVLCDFYDAGLGDQVGIDSQGNAVVLLSMGQRGAVLLAGAVDHWIEHGCQEAIQLALYIMLRVGSQMKELLPSLTGVADYTPFEH